MEFRNTANGMEVYLKEKAQYYKIGGEAMSREAAAHYYAIRGEDVWLVESVDSVQEAYEDPNRQMEAQIEVEFGCQALAAESQR